MKKILPYVLFVGLSLFGDIRGEEVKPKLDKKAKHELFYGVSWKKLLVDGITDPRNVAGFYREEGLGRSRMVKLTEKEKAAYAAKCGKTPGIGDWTRVLLGLADEFDDDGKRRAAGVLEHMGGICDAARKLGRWDMDIYWRGERKERNKRKWVPGIPRWIPRASVSCDAFKDYQARDYRNRRGGVNGRNGGENKKIFSLNGSVNTSGIGIEFRRGR